MSSWYYTQLFLGFFLSPLFYHQKRVNHNCKPMSNLSLWSWFIGPVQSWCDQCGCIGPHPSKGLSVWQPRKRGPHPALGRRKSAHGQSKGLSGSLRWLFYILQPQKEVSPSQSCRIQIQCPQQRSLHACWRKLISWMCICCVSVQWNGKEDFTYDVLHGGPAPLS